MAVPLFCTKHTQAGVWSIRVSKFFCLFLIHSDGFSIYGTDLMKHRICMRVRGLPLASARDTTSECIGYHSRVRGIPLASAWDTTYECEINSEVVLYLRVKLFAMSNVQFFAIT